jgi:hydrogenase/urease accessory protein HupE
MRRRLARAFLTPFVLVAMAIDGSLFDLGEVTLPEQ